MLSVVKMGKLRGFHIKGGVFRLSDYAEYSESTENLLWGYML